MANCRMFKGMTCHSIYLCDKHESCAIADQMTAHQQYRQPGETAMDYILRLKTWEREMSDREPGGPLDPAVCDNVGPPPRKPEPPNLPAAAARIELQRWKSWFLWAIAFIALAIVAVGCMVFGIVVPVLQKIDRQHCCGHEVTGDNHGSGQTKPVNTVRPAADSK